MKTAETVLDELLTFNVSDSDKEVVELMRQQIIKAMHEFASQSRWIDCKERLPEEDRNVIVFQDNKYVTFGWLLRGEKWIGSVSDSTIDVTHWQPLPTPPQNTKP